MTGREKLFVSELSHIKLHLVSQGNNDKKSVEAKEKEGQFVYCNTKTISLKTHK